MELTKDASGNIQNLKENTYPGRGIIIGLDSSGENAIQVYWVMGRSENSRNRILVQDGDVVKTKAFDESKVADPSLIIYNAMLTVGDSHIVSNGDQTDTIQQFLKDGKTFEDGIKTREFEPDAPNFTPRISGVINFKTKDFILSSILKNEDTGEPDHRFFYYKDINSGFGMCVHTYQSDGNPIPSFRSNPYSVLLEGNIDQIANFYWGLLNADNKVAIVVKSINLETNKSSYKIINKLS